MSTLVVRRLQVDLEAPFERHWNGGDAFRSAFFNALSFSFPAGEQLFIDAVRQGLATLPPAAQAAFADEVRGFVGQEATHRRIHERFNAQLRRQGDVNHWERRILRRRRERLEGRDPRAWLAVTAATEHFTAIFADWLLVTPAALAGAEPRLRDLWLWHSAEESEHRSTAFDLYRALGGNERWRRRIFLIVTLHFAGDLARQTLHGLWRDGSWRRLATWRSAWRLLLARGGLLPQVLPAWRRYFDAGFHPGEADATAGAAWLAAHGTLAPPVAAAPQGAA